MIENLQSIFSTSDLPKAFLGAGNWLRLTCSVFSELRNSGSKLVGSNSLTEDFVYELKVNFRESIISTSPSELGVRYDVGGWSKPYR